MKIPTLTAFSFFFLLSTVSAQTPPQARPAADAAVHATAADVSADYRLTPGDKIRIEVYRDAQLSQSLQIRPDGKVTLPLLGDIPAAGRTALELRDDVSNSLKDYITNPVVTVMVVEATPQVVYVMGEVQKPGTLELINGRLSIMQALAMAGGFTDFANRKDIRIQRKGAKGMEVLKFNYKQALNESKEPLQLLPGDTVIVK